MRTTFVLATLLAFGLGGAPAAAQTFGFGAHAGVSVPTGDYGDAAKLGFLGGLDLWYPLATVSPALTWYSSVDAIAHSLDRDDADTGFFYVPVMTGLRFDIPVGPVAAFATGQLGLVVTRGPSLDFTTGPITVENDPEWNTDFGFNVGGGLQLTDNVYAGVKYYPLNDVGFGYEGVEESATWDVSFLDIYVGFGVR
jgi:hypothetical protein